MPVSRAKGHSAVAGAAYRAGQNLTAFGQGESGEDKVFRYKNRGDVVREAFIMTADGAPQYAKDQDRETLWNEVEKTETRVNARLGREIQLGLAYELTHEEQRALVEEYVKREVTDRGFVADIAIHNYGRTYRSADLGGSEADVQQLRQWASDGVEFLESDEARAREGEHVRIKRSKDGNISGFQHYQPHAHVRITPRVAVDGEWVNDKKASRELNKHDQAMNWRYDWAKLQNVYLERAGSEVRVTCTPEDEGGAPVYRQGKGDQNVIDTIEDRLKSRDEPDDPKEKEKLQQQREANEEAKARREADAEFKQSQNDVLKEAQIEQLSEDGATEPEEDRQYRIANWYRNVGQRLEKWRDAIPEKAAAWRERLADMKPRLKAWFGYDPPNAGDNTTHGLDPPEAKQPVQKRDEPEQEP